jgi:hypothetical protein
MNIIEIPDGESVPGPGVYRMSMAHYHSQDCCPGPSISSSGLRTIWSQSPYHFWMTSDLNEDRLPSPVQSDALTLGKAAHALMLGEEDFDATYCYVPADAPQRPTKTQRAAFERTGEWSEAAAPGAAFWEEFDAKAADRTLLQHEQVERIVRMSASLKANPLAVEALTGHLTEVSLIWEDTATGVWLKSRIDVIPANGFDFADLKTFAPRTKSIKRAVQQAITDNEYPMQMGLGQIGAQVVLGHEAAECVLILLQSTAPYTCTPVHLDEEALYWGRVKCRSAIDTFAKCMETGYWPQPVEDVLPYTLPDSQMHRLGEMQINGELPSIER